MSAFAADKKGDKSKGQKKAMVHPEPFGINTGALPQMDRKFSGKILSKGGKKAVALEPIKKNLGGKQRLTVVKDATMNGISKPAIRRLARRGGVKRISKPIYDEIRQELRVFLEGVLKDATTYCDHGKRKTVRPLDVVYALKRKGRDLYGYGV